MFEFVMKVILKLFGRLKDISSFSDNRNNITITLNDGAKILDILDKIKIPKEHIALILINNKTSDFDSVLNEGDIVILYPPIAGG